MATYRIELMPLAIQDLASSYRWIANSSPDAAERWMRKTRMEIETLSAFPERCPFAPENEELNCGVRQLVIGKRRGRYRVIFCVKDTTVQVLRIMHGMRERLTPKELEESGW